MLTSMTRRTWAPGVNQVDNALPVKAGSTIFAGAALMWNAGYLVPVSGSGAFAGFALEGSDAVAGESDGDRVIEVRQQGAVELDINTDTVAASDLGNSGVTIEATDDNTFRIEPGAAIVGTTIGQIMRIVTPGVAGRVLTSFKSAMIA